MAMSDEHKAALKQGREESRAIKAYLEALGARKPGRPVTKESVTARIERLEQKIAGEGNPLKAVEFRQARLEAEQQLADLADPVDLEALEESFAKVVSSYSERKGISYAAWREQGVPAAVLKTGGIKRGD
jgi:hypothetical protein